MVEPRRTLDHLVSTDDGCGVTDAEFTRRLELLKQEIAATDVHGQYDYMKDYRSGLQMALVIMEHGELLIP